MLWLWPDPEGKGMGGEHVLQASGLCVSVPGSENLKMVIRNQNHDPSSGVPMCPRNSDVNWKRLELMDLVSLVHVPEKVWDPKFCGSVGLGHRVGG